MKKIGLIFVLAATAYAADEPKAAEAPKELAPSVRADVAVAQRDFLVAKANAADFQAKFTAAQAKLGAEYDKANKACDAITKGSTFDGDKIACVAPPPPAPAPAKDTK